MSRCHGHIIHSFVSLSKNYNTSAGKSKYLDSLLSQSIKVVNWWKSKREIWEKKTDAVLQLVMQPVLWCYATCTQSFTSNNQQLVVHENNKTIQWSNSSQFRTITTPFPNKHWILISCSTCNQILWTSKNQTAWTHIFNSNPDSRTFCERPEGGIGSSGTATKWTVWWDCFLNCCFQGQELQLVKKLYSSKTPGQTQSDDEHGVRWFTFPEQVLMDRLLRLFLQ